jgi:hypothetical protein
LGLELFYHQKSSSQIHADCRAQKDLKFHNAVAVAVDQRMDKTTLVIILMLEKTKTSKAKSSLTRLSTNY